MCFASWLLVPVPSSTVPRHFGQHSHLHWPFGNEEWCCSEISCHHCLGHSTEGEPSLQHNSLTLFQPWSYLGQITQWGWLHHTREPAGSQPLSTEAEEETLFLSGSLHSVICEEPSWETLGDPPHSRKRSSGDSRGQPSSSVIRPVDSVLSQIVS